MRWSTILLVLFPLSFPLSLTAQTPTAVQPPEVQEATRKAQSGDLAGAIAILEPLRKKGGTQPATLLFLGGLYIEAGRAQDALAVLSPLADAQSAEPLVLYTGARAALAARQTEKAIGYLQRAAAKVPTSPAARDLGILLGTLGRLEESYRYLRPYALARPEDPETRLSAAYAAVELKRATEAEELLGSLPQENPRVRLLRGRLSLLRNDPKSALAALEPLATNTPKELEHSVRWYLAETHLALGASDKAIGLLEGRVTNDPPLALLLGRAYYQAGTPEKTAATLEPFAKEVLGRQGSAPSFDAGIAWEYGRALVALSKGPDAIPILNKAAQLDPRNPQVWQLLGQAQSAAGQREDAAKSLQKFRELQGAQKPGR